LDPAEREKYARYAGEKLGYFKDEWEKPGPIKYRLYHGWMNGPGVVIPSRLPDGLRQEFEALREAISWLPPGPEAAEGEWPGTITATIEAMSEEEALALADKILELHASLGSP
jgi:hypothetical protein